MNKIPSVLANIPLFSGLTEEQLNNIAAITLKQHYHKGELIFSEGDDGKGFFIIIEGQIKIFKLSPEGKEKILHIFGAGEPFGEVAVFSGAQFPANAQATAKTHLLFIPRDKMMTLIRENPSVALKMLAVLSQRLRQFTLQIENLTLKEVPGRIATYLIYLTKEQNSAEVVRLYISKGQLASLLGTIPETLSRIFAKMTDQKLIKVDSRTIRICDAAGLRELAGLDGH